VRHRIGIHFDLAVFAQLQQLSDQTGIHIAELVRRSVIAGLPQVQKETVSPLPKTIRLTVGERRAIHKRRQGGEGSGRKRG
jgi:hypothetical protein